MKKRVRTRILSIVFCVALLFSLCNILNVFAVDNVEGGLKDKTTVITEFTPIDETVTNQTVPYGTPLEALILPDTLSVSGYIYNENVTEPVPEAINLENVSWTAEPDYDGNTAGNYVFSPVLSSCLVKTDITPSVLITVADQEEGIPEAEPVTEDWYKLEENIDFAAMEAGLENNPRPLTMDDLIADFGIQESGEKSDRIFTEFMPKVTQNRMLLNSAPLTTQSMAFLDAAPVTTYPDTIVIGEDNENNAHSGISDKDIDVYMNGWKSNYPIEISFTLDELPAESAYIAVKAYDVDEESGEKDYVFINDAPAGVGDAGASIGYLSGNDNKWNTTVLQIPLSKLKLGKNYVSFNISRFWCVTVDWVQIILDGGAVDANISDFSIKLDDAVQSGSNVQISALVNIYQSGSTEYYTEYMLTNKAGDNLSSYFGKAASEETATLSMPLNSATGTYTVTGLIKDKTTETIKATDSITFDFVTGQVPVFGPKVSHTCSPSAFTNGNVTIQLAAENDNPDVSDVQIWYKSGDITGSTSGNITTANQSVSENGTYVFTIKFIRNGVERTTTYNVEVTNIDRVGPTITAANINVIEGTDDADVLAAIDNAIVVNDDVSLPADPYTVSPDNGFAANLKDKTVTITARDTAGNESAKDITLTVTPRPVQITQHEADVNSADLTASLSATLNYTGGLDITESGFVWGVSQNPTYQVCNGKKAISGSVAKGGSISATAENILEGVNYYARAYIKAGSTYYYSDQKNFGIGAPRYGSFSVSVDAGDVPADGGKVTFTISRSSDQTEGSQTVYYRTVNGTAVGGLHFQHEIGTLTFAPGEYTKTVDVTVNGVSKQYETYPATAYQNSGRSFYLEIYKVEGGATITAKNAKKTIALDGSKQVYAGAYNQYSSVDYSNSSEGRITDDGFNAGGNKEDKDTVSFTNLSNTAAAYLDATADHYALKYNVKIKERYKGYQLIQVTARTQNIMYFTDDTNLYDLNFGNDVFCAAVIEHGGGGSACTSYSTYTFPKCSVTKKRAKFTDNNTAINIGKNKVVYVYYDASGSSDDDWYKDEFFPSIRAMDTTEPQLIAVAPMAGGTYSYGDEVYVSLVFDEIINSASGVTIDTNLSAAPFVYVDGIGTNILVFKGIVDKDGQNFATVTVNAINNVNSIKDIADYVGTQTANTGPSADFDANTIRPGISFAGSTTGTLPLHTAEVKIDSAVSAQYTWSQNNAMPASGWMSFADAAGGTLTESLTGGSDGTAASWYLHVLATHENGNNRWEYREFTFQQPTMSVTADNSDWAQSRDITLTVTNSPGAPVNIAVTGAGTGTYTVSQNVNVTANGTYIFTLTDAYGSNIIKSVDAVRVDNTEPVITLNEYGNTGIKYTSLDFSAVAVDEENGSGLSTLQYAWADSTAVPADGWTEIAVPGGSIPTYETPGTAYLYIKAIDNAGNTAYACSKVYTVMSNTPPTIEVTGGIPADWQKGRATLNYKVQKNGAGITYINAGGTVMQDVNTLPASYPYIGSITISENGLYTFMVMDENGLSDTKSIVVNYIDNEAPVASFDYGFGNSADSWAQSKTVSINAKDEASSIVDSTGAVTGYGGSGVASVEWKKGSEGIYTSIINGGSFPADENDTYYVKVTDKVGNSTEYTLPISGIDTIFPTVGITTSTGWQKAGYGVVTYSDDYSGIASAQYAVAASRDVIPAALSDLPGRGEKVAVSEQGTSYIYYVITDNAGNKTSGWSEQINVDNSKPELTVSAHKGTADGEVYTSGEWTNNDVVFTLGNNETQLSDTGYQIKIGGEDWKEITGNTYTISADTNTTYQFKAVSGANLSDESSITTVRIQKSLDKAMDTSMLTPQPNTDSTWYTTDTTITVNKPTADEGKPVIAVKYKLWNNGKTEPNEALTLADTTITIPADGKWNLKIWTEDEAGNSTEPITESYYVDTIRPVIENVQYQIINDHNTFGELNDFIEEGNYFNKAIRVTVTVSDAMSTSAFISYRLGDSGDYSENITVAKATNTARFDLPLGTNNTLSIMAKDVACNQTETPTTTGEIIIEESAPVITFTGADVTVVSGDEWLQGAQTVTVNISDSPDSQVTSSLDNVEITVKRWDGTAYTENMTDLNQNFTNMSGLAATAEKTHNIVLNTSGKYELTVTAADRAGNTADKQIRYINVDADNPADNPVLTLDGTEVDNTTYYQASEYTVVPAVESDVKQSSIKAQYKLSNTTNTANNADNWTDVPENITLAILEGINTVQLRTIDEVGSASGGITYTVRIDQTAPTNVTISGASEEWQNEDIILTVSATDEGSGIKEYCVSTDGGMSYGTAQAWNVAGTNQFTIETNGDYTDKIKVRVKNNAGLETESSAYTVRMDKVTPDITVSAHKGTADGEVYTSGEWTNNDVVFTLGNNKTQISGTGYQIKIGGGDWEEITGNTYTISADTNTTYQFKAVSGANLSNESSATTVRIQKSLDKAMDTSMLTPQPNTDSTWYTTDTTITVNKPAANEGKPVITVKYKLWKNGETEPNEASTLADTTITIPADGKWNLKLWTEDEAENGTEPITESYYVDTTRPVIKKVQYQIINGHNTFSELNNFIKEGNYFNKAIRVTVTVSDAMSTSAFISYRLGDSGDYSENITVAKATNTARFDLPLGTNNTLSIMAKDVACNQTETPTTTGKIIIEESKPVITFSGADVTAVSGDVWMQGAQTVTVNINDSPDNQVTSSLDNAEIIVKRWDGTAYTENMTELNQNFTNMSGTAATAEKTHNIVLNTSGKYELTVTAADRGDNTADKQIRYINVDADNPADNPVLMLEGTEVNSEAYYQASEYTVVPAVESDVKQSSIKAQYKLSNITNTANNADNWTDVPENNTLAILEGINTVQLRTIDEVGNISDGMTYTVSCDITRPTIKRITPANGAKDQNITPVVSFNADEPLVKGDGYITIFSKPLKTKVMDIHSSNNRVKLSNQNKTVTVDLPQPLKKGKEYYIVVDNGFVTDRAGNKLTGFGSENTWRFKTVANPVIPDSEIVVLGYTVDLISKSGADAAETTQTLTSVTDKEAVRQHNIIAKASYTENGTDKYLKLKITPMMSATPQEIRVSATEGTVTLSSDKKYIDLLIPQGASEAILTISLGSGTDNQFTIKIINSGYKAKVETSGGITAAADESNLLNSVDLSEEVDKAKKPNTTVDVTVKMNIERKEETELPETEEIQEAARTGNLLFLDITMEKVVTTTIEGGSSETETETIKATQQPVVITIDLPEKMQGRYNYQIVREHKGVIDIIPATVIDNGTRLRFEADRFSTYAINYTPRRKHKIIYPDAGVSADTITDVPVVADNTNIDSIKAESNRISVDAGKLNVNTDTAGDINSLLPYYIEDDKEIIAAFSAVIDGQMKWIAQEGKIYWFKYNCRDFEDIQTHWARNDIRFTSARELFNGTAPDIFSPDMSMTRGMFVTVMGRMWGVDVSSFTDSSFTDVAADAWYAPYVEWAADADIVSGYGNRLFGPNDKITREQMAVIITNFADYTGVELKAETAADVFADNDSISPWAVDAVKTMQKASIINGKSNNCFAPKDTAARAEVAAVLKRLIENAVEN